MVPAKGISEDRIFRSIFNGFFEWTQDWFPIFFEQKFFKFGKYREIYFVTEIERHTPEFFANENFRYVLLVYQIDC